MFVFPKYYQRTGAFATVRIAAVFVFIGKKLAGIKPGSSLFSLYIKTSMQKKDEPESIKSCYEQKVYKV